MAKGKGRKGTRKAADVKIADTVEKNLDLKKAETLFDELSHVACKKFRDRMQRVKEVIREPQKGVISGPRTLTNNSTNKMRCLVRLACS